MSFSYTQFLLYTHAHMLNTKRKASYLDYFVQNPLISLIFAIAEETVCVHTVRITIQFDMHVVRALVIIHDHKGDLC